VRGRGAVRRPVLLVAVERDREQIGGRHVVGLARRADERDEGGNACSRHSTSRCADASSVAVGVSTVARQKIRPAFVIVTAKVANAFASGAPLAATAVSDAEPLHRRVLVSSTISRSNSTIVPAAAPRAATTSGNSLPTARGSSG